MINVMENGFEDKEAESKENQISASSQNEKSPGNPKKRKTVDKLCRYCHKFFTANRIDALFCSPSCRQMANKKGFDLRSHGIPAEHFLIKALKLYILEIRKYNDQVININQVDRLRYLMSFTRPLFIDELGDENHLVRFFSKHIEQYVVYLNKQFRNLDTNQFHLDIPESTLDEWQRFLNATE
jgi:hypothetical protein